MDFAPSSVIDFKFSTSQDGVPTTLAGTPVVAIYKDNSTTQSTTGVTLSVDFDGMTGCHNVRVDTADAFYASGSSFQGIITTGTVGGNSAVGHVAFEFSLDRGRVGSIKDDAVNADALATDAVTELQSGLATTAHLQEVEDKVDTVDTVADAIKAKTDNLPSDPADASVIAGRFDTLDTSVADLPTNAELATALGDIPTDVENADALLGRNINGGSSSGRKVKDALKASRNKVDASSGTQVDVYEENDTDIAWSLALTTNAAALPITKIG